MYSIQHHPGKFEANPSQLLAETVYNKTCEGWGDSLGDTETFGYFHYVEGKRYGFILNEDGQGFVYVDSYPKAEAQAKWKAIEKEYAEYCDKIEDCYDIDN